MTELSFTPQWTSHPGETISDLLDERKMNVNSFSKLMGAPLEVTAALLAGIKRIDDNLANRLARVLGGSDQFWLTRQSQHDEDLSAAAEAPELLRDWMRTLPLADMRRFGWLPTTDTIQDRLQSCLEFFDISSVRAWDAKYGAITSSISYRKSSTYESLSGATAAWLRQAELSAGEISCAPWHREGFLTALADARPLTKLHSPEAFVPPLRKLCADNGVALTIVPAPKGCTASGATWFETAEKAVLVLSYRYRSDDQFWFTFFHEAAHLLLHPREQWRLEWEEDDDRFVEEQEANDFAAALILPHSVRGDLSTKRFRSTRDVLHTARAIGISPGLLVGQLQHMGVLERRRLNSFKRFFDWGRVDRAITLGSA